VVRKDEQLIRLTALRNHVSPGLAKIGHCPHCDIPVNLIAVYREARYDVSLEAVYAGRYGEDLIEEMQQQYEAGEINLSTKEKELLARAMNKRPVKTKSKGQGPKRWWKLWG
jgi:hypothetical protein